MKLSLAIFIFVEVTSVFCNATTVDDDPDVNHELLSSEGKYKDGKLISQKIYKKLIHFSKQNSN